MISWSFFALLSVVIILVFYTLQHIAKPILIEEHKRRIEETGNKIIAELGKNASIAETLAATIANFGESSDKNPETYMKVVPLLLDLEESGNLIAGGGIWPEPFSFDVTRERRSFFWGRDKNGRLQYFDDYNNPEGGGYHREEWYVPARFSKEGKCFWSKSYLDPYSLQPMVTCSVAMKNGNKFDGVATVDIRLEGLRDFFEESAKDIGGYIFALDRNNRFITYPNGNKVLKETRDSSGNVTKEFLSTAEFSLNNPLFKPLHNTLEELKQNALLTAARSPSFNQDIIIEINKGSDKIGMAEAKLISSILADPLKKKTRYSNKLDSLYIENDPILREASTATIFHTPGSYWKIVIVSPYRLTVAPVNKITSKLLTYLVVMLVGILLLAFLLLREKLLLPLKKMTAQLKEIEVDFDDLSLQLDVISNNELGELAYYFNKRTEERAIAEKEVVKAKKLMDNIINSMPAILISTDDRGFITGWNSSATESTGIEKREAMGRQIFEIVPVIAIFKKDFHEVLKTRIHRDFHRQKLFRERFTTVSIFPLIANGLTGAVIRLEDTTELEKKEAQLRQSQKMETIGTLAGGLAHDFNNVLGGITGSLSILRFKMKKNGKNLPQSEIENYLETIDKSSKRAANMVQQLLSISRKNEFTSVPLDLNKAVKNIMKVCENSFDKSIGLSSDFFEKPAMISGDPTQIEQVLLNLCVNAAHAMTIMRKKGKKWGGRLSVSIKFLSADKYFLRTHTEAENRKYWVLSITDTGIGMSSETLSKIFNPFFTTKDGGRGTGLGLSMVFNIVKQHGGFINVYSDEGSGSTFNLYLPVLETESKKQEYIENLSEIPRGKGLVLIVDDETVMREIAAEILEECGYNVVTAENGAVGVEIFKARYKEISMVILDLIMPKMAGTDAYAEMKKINPEVKVLLASGFRQDERVDYLLKAGVQAFVQKPYTLETLAEKVFQIVNDSDK